MPNVQKVQSIVMAFDPGPHTGVAIFADGTLTRAAVLYDESMLQMFISLRAEIHRLLQNSSVASTVTVVIEDYRNAMPLTAEGATTLHYIGWLRGVAVTSGVACVLRLPATRITYIPTARALLRDFNVETYGNKNLIRHAVDAVAHGLAYMAHTAKEPK